MRTHSDVIRVHDWYQSGVLSAITTTIIERAYGIPALAARARVPTHTLKRMVWSGVAQREMASFECFLRAQGAVVRLWIDTQLQPVRLASIPEEYRTQAMTNVALTRRQAYRRTSQDIGGDADWHARQSLEAYQAKLAEDLAQPLTPAPPVTATSLVQIAHDLLRARQAVGRLRWTDQALMLSAGMLQAKMRAAAIRGRPVLLLSIIDALMTTLGIRLQVEVGTQRLWTLGTATALPSVDRIPQQGRTIRPGPRTAIGASVLVRTVLDRIAEQGITVADMARSAHVSAGLLSGWQRTGTDRALAQMESLLCALGCRLAIKGSPRQPDTRLPSIDFPPERIRPAANDVAAIMRPSVAAQTGLKGAALERAVRARIADRLRLLRQAVTAPLVEEDGAPLMVPPWLGDRLHDALLRVVQLRRADRDHGLTWPIVDLVLISGVPRQAITALLAASTSPPAEIALHEVLRALHLRVSVHPAIP